MENNIDWQKIQREFKQELMTLPAQMGTVAVNFFKDRFRAQAWTDEAASPWKARKPGSKRNKGRGILISSGRLRNSIRIVSTTANSVTVGTDVPYAEVHNEGFTGTQSVKGFKRKKFHKSTVYSTQVFNIKSRKGRKSTVKNEVGESYVKPFTRKMDMPRRRFIGESKLLTHKLEQLITKVINKIFHNS